MRFTEGRERLVCTGCGFIFYRNPVPASAVIVQNDGALLLVKRKFPPREGDWSLPAGFMEWGEGPEETAIRETKEETSLDIKLRGLYGIFPGRDYPPCEVILVVYYAEIVSGDLQPGDDALEAKFFPLSETPPNIAFRLHRNIVEALRHNGSAASSIILS